MQEEETNENKKPTQFDNDACEKKNTLHRLHRLLPNPPRRIRSKLFAVPAAASHIVYEHASLVNKIQACVNMLDKSNQLLFGIATPRIFRNHLQIKLIPLLDQYLP